MTKKAEQLTAEEARAANQRNHPLLAATEAGYWGEKVDPAPNDQYTVAGVTAVPASPAPEAPQATDEQ